jgi:hypothetical protein
VHSVVKRVYQGLLLSTAMFALPGSVADAQWSDEICVHNALTKVIGPQPPLAPFVAPAAPAPPAR